MNKEDTDIEWYFQSDYAPHISSSFYA